MKRYDKFSFTIKLVEIALEIALLSLTYYYAWDRMYAQVFYGFLQERGRFVLMGVYALIIIFIFNMTESTKFGHNRISVISVSQCISMFIANFISYFQLCLMANRVISVYPMFIIFALDCLICVLLTYIFTYLYHSKHKPYNMLMIYYREDDKDIIDKINSRPDKYKLNKRINISEGIREIKKEILSYDAVIISDIPSQKRNDLIKYCYEKNIRTYVVPKISDIIISNSDAINLFDTPVQLIKSCGLTIEQRAIKRLFDIVLSLFALIVLSPLMIIVALAIKLEDGGSVFFCQNRVTIDEKVFKIYKFRSMIVNAESCGYSLNLRAKDEDPRITKVGKIIRACRIDELPQLINILKGDMSIVGPRPERVENHEEYKKIVPEWVFRTKVKGGLTGYAQIYGKYNTTPYDKIRLDLQYIEGYSLLLDIKMIFMTLQVLTKKESTEGFKDMENKND